MEGVFYFAYYTICFKEDKNVYLCCKRKKYFPALEVMKTNKNVSSASFIRALPKQFTFQAVQYLRGIKSEFNKDTYLDLIEKDCLEALKVSKFSSYPSEEEILYSSQHVSPPTFDYLFKSPIRDIHSYLIALDKKDNSSLFKHVCKKYNFNPQKEIVYCTNLNIIKFIITNYDVEPQDVNMCFLLCCSEDKIDSVRYLISLNVDIQEGMLEAAGRNAYYTLHYFLDNYEPENKDEIASSCFTAPCIQLLINKGYTVPNVNIAISNNYRLAINYIKWKNKDDRMDSFLIQKKHDLTSRYDKMLYILKQKGYDASVKGNKKMLGVWYLLYNM